MAIDVLRAIASGNLEKLNELIKSGSDVHEVTEVEDWNYLHKAFLSPRRLPPSDIICYLVDLGLNVNAVDCYGNTPLHYAVRQKNPPCIKALLEKGAEKSLHQTNIDGVSPLRQAFIGQPYDYESIKTLLEYGADLDVKNGGGSVRERVNILAGIDDGIMELIEKY